MSISKETKDKILERNNISKVAEEANTLHRELLKDFSKTEIPLPDFDNPIFDIDFSDDEDIFNSLGQGNIDDITERKFGGKGIFDALLESVNNHIRKYYEDNLITKDAIPKIVASSIESAMSNSIQYALNKDLAKLEALKAKYGVYNSIMQLETSKALIRYQLFQGFNEEAKYTNIKMDTLNKESVYNTSEWNLNNMLPSQKTLLESQTLGQNYNNDTIKWNLEKRLPVDKELVEKQIEGQVISNDTSSWNLKEILPQNKKNLIAEEENIKSRTANTQESTKQTTQNILNLKAQKELTEVNIATAEWNLKFISPLNKEKLIAENEHIKTQTNHLKAVIAKVDAEIILTNEQYEATRGQTMDTRTDGTIILGSIGKQKDLHSAQIRAYKNDAEYKLAQMYSNAYLAQAASDPGIKPPNQYTQTEIDKVISTVKVNLGV